MRIKFSLSCWKVLCFESMDGLKVFTVAVDMYPGVES